MDYIKLTEEKLKDYRYLERSLENMAAEIGRLQFYSAPKGLKVAAGDETGIRGSGRPEQDMEQVAIRIRHLKEERVVTQKEIQRINVNLNFISRELGCENYGDLLKLWYIGKREMVNGRPEYTELPKEEIAEMLGYSERNIYYTLKKAIRKLAKAYWGVRVN